MKYIVFLFPLFSWASSICYFVPPSGWQAAKPKTLSEHVQIGFVGKGSSDFHPSMNLATEAVQCSLKEYVKAVKEVHLSQTGTTWRDLGKVNLKFGLGRLTEITSSSAWGDIVMLQLLTVQNKTAYILTAATLKKDFPSFQKEVLESLNSIRISDSLFSAIEEPALRSKISSFFETLGGNIGEKEKKMQWESLQQIIAKDTASLGGCWQFLALKEGYAKIYPGKDSH